MDLTPGRSRQDRVVPSSSKRDNASEQQAADKELVNKAWDNKKYQEDCDTLRAKLSDQNFNIRHYPDPLLGRALQVVYPQGTDAAMEDRLRETMKKYYVPPVASTLSES